MQTSFWKYLMVTGGLSILPACGGEFPNAGESLERAGGSAFTANAQELTRAQSPALPSSSPGKFLKSANAVPGQYIVVLKDSALGTARVHEVAQRLALPQSATVTMTYEHALRGFVVRTSEAGARAIAARPEVDYVVEDNKISINEPPMSVKSLEENGKALVRGTQPSPSWGLDRIDQINLPLNGTYSYPGTGAGVHAYIIDSGILTSHSDFGGRASADYTAINDGYGAGDCYGHGTFVAGIVGGSTYGVAKGVLLHSVRVLDCTNQGTESGFIAGVNWVTAHAIKPAVANVSLAFGGLDPAADMAVRNSIASGITYVVAAGNSNAPACNYSPADVAEAITVGATNSSDTRASFSNYGTCVDLFAPGESVTSDFNASNSSTGVWSGTSFSAPHVAGVAALYLAGNPSAAPATVATAVVYASPVGKVNNAGIGSPNRLLHSTPLTACSVLSSGDALSPGQTISSCNGKATLAHQTDGNVVVYQNQNGVPLWNTVTPGQTTSSFIMQTDGNLVLYSGTGSPLWVSGTAGNSGAYLAMQDDCNLVVYSASGTPLWWSGAFCR